MRLFFYLSLLHSFFAGAGLGVHRITRSRLLRYLMFLLNASPQFVPVRADRRRKAPLWRGAGLNNTPM